ncbi:TIGR03086 family metal-binding protein [Dietzia sp. MNB45]|uniref:TIGR03086 family metal-binding protein n=1 Tax=Dietzia sp. MNB45 TaxID=3238800 RepID=UPI003F7D14AF
MNTTAERYGAAREPLTDLIETVPAASWSSSSPCEGWTARDIVRHIIDTQRDFLATHGVDLGEEPNVHDDPARAWRDHAGRVQAKFDDTDNDDTDVAAIAFEGFFGPTTVGAALEQFYIWDMVVHRWDIARATGLDAGLTDAEIDEMEQGAHSFGDALYMDGICRPGVTAPSGAGRLEQVLARLGRVA